MKKRKYMLSFMLLMTFILIFSGCSSNKGLLDEQGKEVSLAKDKPSLVFFFTGNS